MLYICNKFQHDEDVDAIVDYVINNKQMKVVYYDDISLCNINLQNDIIIDNPYITQQYMNHAHIPDTYSNIFKGLYKRNIKKDTFFGIKQKAIKTNNFPLFLKPACNTKKWEPLIIHTLNDLFLINTIDNDEMIYASNVIGIDSEYRVFIDNHTKKYYIQHYDLGLCNTQHLFSDDFIQQLLQKSMPYLYLVVDIGVNSQKEEIIIEVNPPFFTGSYGLNPTIYAEFAIHSWKYLISRTI